MRKMKLTIFTLIFSMLFANAALAKSYDSLPEPEWSISNKFMSTSITMLGDVIATTDGEYVRFLQNSDGSLTCKIDAHRSTGYYSPGLSSAIDTKKGRLYIIQPTDSSSSKKMHLTAYDTKGKTIWSKPINNVKDRGRIYL